MPVKRILKRLKRRQKPERPKFTLSFHERQHLIGDIARDYAKLCNTLNGSEISRQQMVAQSRELSARADSAETREDQERVRKLSSAHHKQLYRPAIAKTRGIRDRMVELEREVAEHLWALRRDYRAYTEKERSRLQEEVLANLKNWGFPKEASRRIFHYFEKILKEKGINSSNRGR